MKDRSTNCNGEEKNHQFKAYQFKKYQFKNRSFIVSVIVLFVLLPFTDVSGQQKKLRGTSRSKLLPGSSLNSSSRTTSNKRRSTRSLRSRSGGSNKSKGIVAEPLSDSSREKFANAQPEDITSENFPELIESFDYQNADITDIIKAMGELTGKNFIIDPKVRGKITIIAPSQITVAEAYRAFLSALAINGFTIVPSGKFLKVRQSRSDANRDSINTYSGDYFPNSDQLITYIMQLKHISAAKVRKDIRILNSKDGEVSVYEPTNALIITDYGSNVERAVKILSSLDTPGFQDKMEVMPVKHAKAKDIAELIDQIVSKKSGGSSSSSRRRGSFSNSRRSSNNSTSVNQPRFNVIPDNRTNSLIVVGNQTGIVRIRDLVKKLDFKLAAENSGGVYVYYVKHGVAEEIEKTLQGLTKETTKKDKSTSSRRSTFQRPPTPTEQVFGGSVKVKADKQANSLIVTASRQDYEAILNLLKKIDIPRDQVFVETIIMEMNLSDNHKWGTAAYKFLEGTETPIGYNTISDLGSLLNPTVGQGAILGFGSGEIINLKIGDVQKTITSLIGLVNFLKTNAQTNVLSTPQIMARDNHEAVIEVGERVPIANETTVSAGGTSQSNVKFEDATIKLKIKPFISPNKSKVRLEVDQEVKQLVSRQNKSGINADSISKRNIKTVIEVNNNDTAVLGGLMKDEVREDMRKVPLLGDIPILGWLFRSRSKEVAKINLLVFLTPSIIQDVNDNDQLMGRKLDERINHIKTMGGIDPFGKRVDEFPRKAKLGDLEGLDDDEGSDSFDLEEFNEFEELEKTDGNKKDDLSLLDTFEFEDENEEENNEEAQNN